MESFKFKTNEKFFYPIHMHPHKLYEYQWFNDYKNCRWEHFNDDRKIGMIFIGNNNGDYVHWEKSLKKAYGCYSRPEIINFLCSEFAQNVERPNSIEELNNLLQNKDLSKKILIIDKIRVNGETFIELFLNSDFHIWMPGVTYTYCHNHIESLYCGTIPIHEDKFYYYGLEDKINSLKFSSLDDLRKIINDIISGKVAQENIKELRNNAYKLYDSYYSTRAFKEKIFEFLNSDKREENFYISKDG